MRCHVQVGVAPACRQAHRGACGNGVHAHLLHGVGNRAVLARPLEGGRCAAAVDFHAVQLVLQPPVTGAGSDLAQTGGRQLRLGARGQPRTRCVHQPVPGTKGRVAVPRRTASVRCHRGRRQCQRTHLRNLARTGGSVRPAQRLLADVRRLERADMALPGTQVDEVRAGRQPLGHTAIGLVGQRGRCIQFAQLALHIAAARLDLQAGGWQAQALQCRGGCSVAQAPGRAVAAHGPGGFGAGDRQVVQVLAIAGVEQRPAGAAIGAVEHGTGVAHGPTLIGIAKAHRTQRACGARRHAGPACAAVRAAQQRAGVSHGPGAAARQCHAAQVRTGAAVYRRPALAAVGALHNGPALAYGQAVQHVGKRHGMQALHFGRMLLPGRTAVGGQ